MVVSVAPAGSNRATPSPTSTRCTSRSVGERLERAVDARDADGATVVPDAVVDLLRGQAAALRGEVFDDGRRAPPRRRPAARRPESA